MCVEITLSGVCLFVELSFELEEGLFFFFTWLKGTVNPNWWPLK